MEGKRLKLSVFWPEKMFEEAVNFIYFQVINLNVLHYYYTKICLRNRSALGTLVLAGFCKDILKTFIIFFGI